jgi:transposase
MGRPKEVVDGALALRAKAELNKLRDQRLCARLQAIVSCAEHPITTVAAVYGVNRRTVWLWCRNFRESGVAGLRDKPKGHNPSKLNEEQQCQLERWLADGQNHQGEAVHWTLSKLQNEIESVFGIEVGLTPLWKRVRALGFRQKVPRPRHAQADPEVQEAFKKNPPNW